MTEEKISIKLKHYPKEDEGTPRERCSFKFMLAKTAFTETVLQTRAELSANERLHPFTSGQTPPELAAFTLQTNAHVKEWAAGAFNAQPVRLASYKNRLYIC